MRKVLSDFELMELFRFVLRHGFDTKQLDSEYWETFLALLDVSNCCNWPCFYI